MTDTMVQTIDSVANETYAKIWESTGDKFTYCLDLLDLSIFSRGAEEAVEELESRFEALLSEMN